MGNDQRGVLLLIAGLMMCPALAFMIIFAVEEEAWVDLVGLVIWIVVCVAVGIWWWLTDLPENGEITELRETQAELREIVGRAGK